MSTPENKTPANNEAANEPSNKNYMKAGVAVVAVVAAVGIGYFVGRKMGWFGGDVPDVVAVPVTEAVSDAVAAAAAVVVEKGSEAAEALVQAVAK